MLLIRNKECHSDEAVIKTLAVWHSASFCRYPPSIVKTIFN